MLSAISFVSGYIFPALVAALVPIRSYLVYYMFTEEDLKYLDPFAETLTNLTGMGGEEKDGEEEKKDPEKQKVKVLKNMTTTQASDLSGTDEKVREVEEC
jgi:hypothetical protein